MNEQIDSSIPVLTEIIHAPNSVAVEQVKTGIGSAGKTHAASPRTGTNEAMHTESLTPQISFAPQALISETPADLKLSTDERSSHHPLESAPQFGSDEWALMEQTVRENVLKQVLSRIDFVLEHRVSDSLAEVLQNAIDQLADDIRVGLKQSIQEVVTRAVNQEITKLRSQR